MKFAIGASEQKFRHEEGDVVTKFQICETYEWFLMNLLSLKEKIWSRNI